MSSAPFFYTLKGLDEETSLPLEFFDHYNGDGVAISNDGTIWYTIVNASDLAVSGSFSVNLDDEVVRIQNDFDPSFGYNAAFKIKFQQYDDYPYDTDGRAFDDIDVTGVANMELAIPATASEGDGVLIGAGTVALATSAMSDIEILLRSSDESEVTVPTSVTILKGNTSAAFDLTIVDDTVFDGTQTVIITAMLSDEVSINSTIQVEDDEQPPATLDVNFNTIVFTEGDGVLRGAGTISISEVLSQDLAVTMVSSDESEVIVSADVTVLAGQRAADFDIEVVDDAEFDGTQSVVITASAPDCFDAVGRLDVLDNDVHHLAISAIPTPQIAEVPIPITVQATDINGVKVSTFTGSATISAQGNNGPLSVTPDIIIISSFVAGEWSGTVTISGVDTLVALVLNAASVMGISNPFDVTGGPVQSFVVSPMYTPMLVNDPFSVTISAMDANGYVATRFNGDATLSAVGLSAGAVSPSVITGFIDGVWSGEIAVFEAGTDVSLLVADGNSHQGQSNSFAITDNTLLINVPASALEGDSSANLQGTISVGEAIASDIIVTLISSDSSEVTVPDTILLPAGDTVQVFDIIVVDDNILDGTQSVTITAALASGVAKSDTIDVEDNEAVSLRLDIIPTTADESAGVLLDQATLDVGVVVESDLAVTLSSSDTDEVTVPSTVIIPAGRDSITFNLVVVDDQVVDGAKMVTITAAAMGQSASDAITILDNDDKLSRFQVSTIDSPQVAGEPIPVTLTAVTGNGTIVNDFNETVTLIAQGRSGMLTISPLAPAFVNGEWNGSVIISDPDTQVTISVDDGAGHVGQSNTFEVIEAVPICNEDVALDLGAPGTDWTVSTDACLRVRDEYPSWWGIRKMSLQNMDGGTEYPVPFTWQNDCGAKNGSDIFSGDWQSKLFGPIDSACATVISLQDSGAGTIQIRYYAN